jgi:aspartate aminotransferase
MSVARTVAQQLERSSWIRRMFEEGARLKRELGADKVFDFTLGNPEVEPPGDRARRPFAAWPMTTSCPAGTATCRTSGFPEVRAAIAKSLHRETSVPRFQGRAHLHDRGRRRRVQRHLEIHSRPWRRGHSAGALFRRVPVLRGQPRRPVHRGRHRPPTSCPTSSASPRSSRRARAPSCSIRPTIPGPRLSGAVLARARGACSLVYPNPPLVISDEPYKQLVYDGGKQPDVSASDIPNTAICYSWSKSQALAGERIGYLALSPRLPDAARMMNACAFANRTLGFVNAPALWQRVMAEAADACVDVGAYEHKRDVLCDGLAHAGYDVRKPEGGYYVFLKTPIPDDVAFVGRLLKQGVLAVPGTGFGRGGYIRLSMTVPMDTILRSLPAFALALGEAMG